MATKRAPESSGDVAVPKKKRVQRVFAKIDEEKAWLFDYPLEIRELVYAAILGIDESVPESQYIKLKRSSSITADAPYNMPNLLISSKKIRQEALPMYLKHHTVSFTLPIDEQRSVSSWLRLFIQACKKLDIESALRNLRIEVKFTIPRNYKKRVYDPAQITKICCTNKISARVVGTRNVVRRGFATVIIGRILGYHAFKVGWDCKLFYETIEYYAESGNVEFACQPEDPSDVPGWGERVHEVGKSTYDVSKTFPVDYRVIYNEGAELRAVGPPAVLNPVVVKYQGKLLLLKDPFCYGPLEGDHVEVCEYTGCANLGCFHHMLTDKKEWLADLKTREG
jgi:hypothetical protein